MIFFYDLLGNEICFHCIELLKDLFFVGFNNFPSFNLVVVSGFKEIVDVSFTTSGLVLNFNPGWSFYFFKAGYFGLKILFVVGGSTFFSIEFDPVCFNVGKNEPDPLNFVIKEGGLEEFFWELLFGFSVICIWLGLSLIFWEFIPPLYCPSVPVWCWDLADGRTVYSLEWASRGENWDLLDGQFLIFC